MKIKVKNLIANPYRNIEVYPIDRTKVEQLRNSIRETSFWDNILARPAPKNGKYQIAYGHHRLIAIKEELGKDTAIDIPVRKLSDEDMLKIMANENMEQWTTDWRVIVETVKQTRKFLEEHSEIAKKLGAYTRGKREVGRIVISKFLGANWSPAKITQALAIMKDEHIKAFSVERIKDKIHISTMQQISTIKNGGAKKEWLKEVVAKNISVHEIEEIARFENESILSDHDKQVVRENILEGRIRGKEQIKEQVEFIKVRKLQEAKKPDEDKRKEQLKNFINRTKELTVSLNNKLQVLAEQFKQHPETKKFLPRVETKKFISSLTMLLLTINELIKTTRGTKEKKQKELKNVKA